MTCGLLTAKLNNVEVINVNYEKWKGDLAESEINEEVDASQITQEKIKFSTWVHFFLYFTFCQVTIPLIMILLQFIKLLINNKY